MTVKERLRQLSKLEPLDPLFSAWRRLPHGFRGAVPAPLMDEITRFVRPLSRKLLRALNRNLTRDPVRVLDVLFDVQQLLLPRLMVA